MPLSIGRWRWPGRTAPRCCSCTCWSPRPPFIVDGYLAPKTYEDLEASARRATEAQLKATLARARKAGARATAMLVEGVPFDQIVRAARRARADLIVIGTHGRTGFSRLFLGSVAERVVQLAHCPVLTVRGK